MAQFRNCIELVDHAIEAMAVVIMATFIIFGTLRSIFQLVNKSEGIYERYRVVLGRTLLIGLELLVASDIIRTVI